MKVQEILYPVLVVARTDDIRGAFHYAKDSGNFGRNSNGKDRFGSF